MWCMLVGMLVRGNPAVLTKVNAERDGQGGRLLQCSFNASARERQVMPKDDIGHIVSIESSIADVVFDGQLPTPGTRLISLSEPQIVIEVASQPASDRVRGLVLNPL